MAQLTGTVINLDNGKNLPPPQVPFVDADSGHLSEDGYKYFTNLLNQLSQAQPTATVDSAVLAAGATQATAAALSLQWSQVIGQRSGGNGVLLSAYQSGQSQTVFNASGVSINIYPQPGSQIDTLGVNIAYALANGARHTFDFVSATQIRS